MKPGDIVAGLDLGSTRTCVVIAQVTGDDRVYGVKVLGVGSCRETGVRGGLVRDIEETTRSIQAAMHDAERMAGVPTPPIYCAISGEHVQLRTSQGLVAITDEEVTRTDVDRVNDVATAVTLGQDRELLHSIPQAYKVDDQDDITDPLGMSGMRMEVDMYLVSVATPAAQNVRKSIERAGFVMARLVFEPLATSLAVLTAEERELGCLLLDLGGSSTGIAILRDGRIRHVATLPYAGHTITNDLVQGLTVTQVDGERLKVKWGTAHTSLVDPDESIGLPSTPGQGDRRAQRELLAHIIHQRLDEVFGLVQQEIEVAGFAGHLPSGVVLTGGTAELPGIMELAREVFGMPARIGVPTRGVRGLVDSVNSPKYVVPVGLTLFAARDAVQATEYSVAGVERILAPMRRWLETIF